jgi:uncharacterized YccA/Bax inhibitor family protein
MIPYEVYKVLHIVGVLLTFAVLGGLALTVASGATKSTSSVRRLIAATHGAGTFIILLGGFGALARLGMTQGLGLPLWIWIKLACWVVLALVVMVPYRRPELARPVFWFLPVLGLVAVWAAIYKPT